jgi:hypothetical protein
MTEWHKYQLKSLLKATPVLIGLATFAYCWKSMNAPSNSSRTGPLPQEGQELSITLENNDVYLPCGSTTEALSELTKWASANDWNEVKRTVSKTGSTLLYNGYRVKMLDRGILKSRVRVLRDDKECWVVSDALRQKAILPEESTASKSEPSGSPSRPLATETEKRTCDVLRAQMMEDKPAGMSRKDFLAWTAKETKHCKDLGLLEAGADANQEYAFAIQAEKTGPRTIHVTVKSDLPDGAQVSIDAGRSYYQKGMPDEYSGEILPKATLVLHSGTADMTFNVDDSHWLADYHERYDRYKGLKGVIGKMERVSPNGEVSAMFHPNGQPGTVSAMVGPNGEFIRGKHSKSAGPYHLLEDTKKVRVPLMADTGAQK